MEVVNLKCDHCTQNIFTICSVAIKCAECVNPTLVLCPNCFVLNPKVGFQHSPSHAYYLIDNLKFPLWPNITELNASSALKIVEHIERYGLDNWDDINKIFIDQTNGNFNAQREYLDFFVEGPLGELTWVFKNNEQLPEDGLKYDDIKNETTHDFKLNEKQYALLGFTPKRKEFEFSPLDGQAEYTVSQLVSDHGSSSLLYNTDDDDDNTKNSELIERLNLVFTQSYNEKLKLRSKRNEIIYNLDLITIFFHSLQSASGLNIRGGRVSPTTTQASKGTTDNQTSNAVEKTPHCTLGENMNKLKFLASVLTDHKEYADFMKSAAEEKRLRARIKELIQFRKNGVTSFSDSVEFKAVRSKRIKEKRDKLKKGQSANGVSSVMVNSINPAGSNGEINDKQSSSVASDSTEFQCKLLTEEETDLCEKLKCTPSYYLNRKVKILLKKCSSTSKGGGGVTEKALSSDDEFISAYMDQCGWIPAT